MGTHYRVTIPILSILRSTISTRPASCWPSGMWPWP